MLFSMAASLNYYLKVADGHLRSGLTMYSTSPVAMRKSKRAAAKERQNNAERGDARARRATSLVVERACRRILKVPACKAIARMRA